MRKALLQEVVGLHEVDAAKRITAEGHTFQSFPEHAILACQAQPGTVLLFVDRGYYVKQAVAGDPTELT